MKNPIRNEKFVGWMAGLTWSALALLTPPAVLPLMVSLFTGQTSQVVTGVVIMTVYLVGPYVAPLVVATSLLAFLGGRKRRYLVVAIVSLLVFLVSMVALFKLGDLGV